MKFEICYNRDTKQMLWASTHGFDDTPDEFKNTRYILHEDADNTDGYLRFFITTELPVYEFRALFDMNCIKKIKTKEWDVYEHLFKL